MISPVSIPFKSFIQIERNSATPIYLQVANQFIQAIAQGKLKPGTKLLGTRALGDLLEVHRNTITAVYEELFGQGWVEIHPNKGTYVASQLPLQDIRTSSSFQYPKEPGYSFKKAILLDSPFEHTN